MSIRADVEILPNANKTTEARPDRRVLTQQDEIAIGRRKKCKCSHKEYVSLALAAPEFGPCKLYANLSIIVQQDHDSLSPDLCSERPRRHNRATQAATIAGPKEMAGAKACHFA
jgi:uncharacterized protein (DUF736 family)